MQCVPLDLHILTAGYEAWIAKVEDITDIEELMDAAAYEAFIQQ